MIGLSRRKRLPSPTGCYAVSCADLMTEFSKTGVFVRLYYPTNSSKTDTEQEQDQGLPWSPHDMYVQGIAFVVGLWTIVLRIVMWWCGGDRMHIPALWEAPLLPPAERGRKKLPVIIFSHGFGAHRALCSTLLTELASQGYLIAALEHRDTSACATYYYSSTGDRDQDERTWIPHTRLELGAQHYPLRNRQVKFRRDECLKALDLLKELNSGCTSSNILKTSLNLEDFEDQLDLENLTVMGHSFGGATALQCLASDTRFRQGVILDGWMFPLKEENVHVSQPLLLINTSTFHIPSNLTALTQLINNPPGSQRQLYEIKNSSHETQTDSPFVFGYWLDLFKAKIDPTLGNVINSYLIIKYLHNITGIPDRIEDIELFLDNNKHWISEGSLPTANYPRKSFSLRSLF